MNKEKTLRILSFALALILCLPLLAQPARAEDPDFLPIFRMEFSVDSEVITTNAFYFEDTNGDGSTYLVSSLEAAVFAEQSDSITIYTQDFTAAATYLGTSGNLAYFHADGLAGMPPCLAGGPVPEQVQLSFQAVNQETQELETVYLPLDLSQGWKEHDGYWTTDAFSLMDFLNLGAFGAPVVDGSGMVVGFMSQLEEVITLLPLEAETFHKSGAVVIPGSTQPSDVPSQPGPDAPSEDSGSGVSPTQMIYIGGGIALVVFVLYLANRKPKSRKNKQDSNSPGNFTGPITASGPVSPNPPVMGTVTLESDNLRTEPVFSGPVQPFPNPIPSEAKWQIRCIGGALEGKTFLLHSALRFGRSGQCEVSFPKGTPGVSAEHCQVSVENGRVVLRDLQSTYGTFLGSGARLEPQVSYTLELGSTFTLAEDGPSFRLEGVGASNQLLTPAVRSVTGGTVYRADMNGRIAFGRDPKSQVPFPQDDKAISTSHCCLYREQDKLFLMDTGSTNGTFFSENQRLKPNVPYRVKKGMSFFLASPKNTYVITED